jgi:hypothetical protein
VLGLLVTASFIPSSPILVTLMKEALSSTETPVLTSATRVTSQKTTFFIVTAVNTSNLTNVFTNYQSSGIYEVTVTFRTFQSFKNFDIKLLLYSVN